MVLTPRALRGVSFVERKPGRKILRSPYPVGISSIRIWKEPRENVNPYHHRTIAKRTHLEKGSKDLTERLLESRSKRKLTSGSCNRRLFFFETWTRKPFGASNVPLRWGPGAWFLSVTILIEGPGFIRSPENYTQSNSWITQWGIEWGAWIQNRCMRGWRWGDTEELKEVSS